MTKRLKPVVKIYRAIVRHDLLEDRREYVVEDLMSAYELSREDALELEELIQQNFRSTK